ncbi:unnamed protein product [Rotaria socialis]
MHQSQNPLQWSAQFGPSLTNSFASRSHQNFDTRPSRLRTPFPPDPGYGDDPLSRRCVTSSNPRVRGSHAKAIYKRAIANTGAPFRLDIRCSSSLDTNSKTGKPPRNHTNENLKRIRRIMQETQKRKSTEEDAKKTAMKPLWRSKEYDNVESKVKQKLKVDSQRSASRPQSVQGNFLRAHGRTGPENLRSQSACDVRRASVGSSVNLEATQAADNKSKPDYVKINLQNVKTIPKVRKSVSTEATQNAREKTEKKLKAYQEKNNGRVPDYIEKIKEKRDQDRQKVRASAPDPECPPGHVKVDKEEHKSTLTKLQANRIELENKLGHLPIRNDSLRLRRAKEDIEKQLVALDEAIGIFSKPKTSNKKKISVIYTMVYLRFHLLILVPFWSLITAILFVLMFFSQIISSSKFDHQPLTIVKSIDDYFCQNYVLTCFFRQRYHQSIVQQQDNVCKSFLILRSCLYNDNDSIRMCHQTTLNRVKSVLTNETPMYCLTSSLYKNLQIQNLRSRATLPKTAVHWQIFVLLFIIHFYL